MALLSAKGITVDFGAFRAVDGVSFDLEAGKCIAIVGESGSGKTTVARSILGLQPMTSGVVMLEGQPVERRNLAKQIGMVWQDPYASLDTRWTIGRSLNEPADICGGETDLETLMRDVGLDPALRDRYPHQLSGGQRQRVAIGRALALRPPVVILDEPTAALDLSVQAQILNLLKDLQASHGLAYIYISHDLHTVRYIADDVVVMQRGKVVESGPVEEVFERPQHEYTQTLLAAAPSLEGILA